MDRGAVDPEDEPLRADREPAAPGPERDRADPVRGELNRQGEELPGRAAVLAVQHGAGVADDPAAVTRDEHVVEGALRDRRVHRRPRGAAVLRAEDDGVDADGPAAPRVDEVDAE